VVAPGTVSLATIRNLLPQAASSARSTTETELIRASGGACRHSRCANSPTRAESPCTSAKTAPESLPTNPARPSSPAMRCTKGRKPTPWTTPVTVKRCRTGITASIRGASVISAGPLHESRIAGAPAHQLQTGQRLLGPRPVRLLDDEAHVDDHPVAGRECLVGQHADVDPALLSGDVDQRELALVTVQHSDDLTGYAQAHGSALLPRRGKGLPGAQRRDDLLHRAGGTGHRPGHRLGEAHALLDVARLAADDHRVGRTSAQRPH